MCTSDTKIILLAILVYLTIIIASFAYLFFYTSFSDWWPLISLLPAGVLILSGLNALLKRLGRPKLKIVRSKIEPQNEGTEGEYKDLYLIVQNVGGEEAIDCLVKANVKSMSQEPYYVVGVPFSLNAGNEKNIRFQQVIKSEQKVQPISEKGPIMDRGNIYEYEIYFYGNFKDTKAHRLRLDLTSWENIGVILDC